MTGWLFPYHAWECPHLARHRPPQGPNEDVAVCRECGTLTYSMRPPGETFGEHLPDCALPVDHSGYCVPGGAGHPPSTVVRGFWP